jgi:hypothetical protein
MSSVLRIGPRVSQALVPREHASLGDVLGVARPEPWMAEGLCAETDPDEFFPEKGDSPRAAKKVCAQCDVLEMCREYALARTKAGEDIHGIWGGLTRLERQVATGKRPERAAQKRRDKARDAQIIDLTRMGFPKDIVAYRVRVSVRTVERVMAKERRRIAA